MLCDGDIIEDHISIRVVEGSDVCVNLVCRSYDMDDITPLTAAAIVRLENAGRGDYAGKVRYWLPLRASFSVCAHPVEPAKEESQSKRQHCSAGENQMSRASGVLRADHASGRHHHHAARTHDGAGDRCGHCCSIGAAAHRRHHHRHRRRYCQSPPHAPSVWASQSVRGRLHAVFTPSKEPQ